MSTRPWTSGPWVPVEGLQSTSIRERLYTVATIPMVAHHRRERRKADIALIAAAPDLAEILISLVEDGDWANDAKNVRAARAALEKAGYKP